MECSNYGNFDLNQLVSLRLQPQSQIQLSSLPLGHRHIACCRRTEYNVLNLGDDSEGVVKSVTQTSRIAFPFPNFPCSYICQNEFLEPHYQRDDVVPAVQPPGMTLTMKEYQLKTVGWYSLSKTSTRRISRLVTWQGISHHAARLSL